MLKIGKLTDYALVLLNQLSLAEKPYDADNGFNKYSVDFLVGETGLTEATIRKVMRFLVAAKLVIAHRGTKGGYQLALPPSRISVADVVSAIEGPVAITECASDDNNCEISARCSLASHWPGINQLVVQLFRQISLQDIRETNIDGQMKDQLLASLAASSQFSHGHTPNPEQLISLVEVKE